MKKCIAGFTLIELMMTLTIAAILVTVAIPSFNQGIRNNRLTTQANEFISALNLARNEAIKRNASVSIRKSGAKWEDGWNVFTDLDLDGAIDAGDDEILRTYPAFSGAYTLSGNNFSNFIRFKASGESNNNGSFILCDNSDGNDLPEAYTSRLILVNKMGRPRMGVDADHDGIPETEGTQATEIDSCV